MENEIFRKKSLEKISSPEELNSYLRVTNPSVWLGLIAIVLFLTGFIVWASVGTLETKTEALAEVDNGEAVIVITGSDAFSVSEGMEVRVDDKTTAIDSIEYDEYGRAVCKAILNAGDGRYKAEVILESIKPISFLFK